MRQWELTAYDYENQFGVTLYQPGVLPLHEVGPTLEAALAEALTKVGA